LLITISGPPGSGTSSVARQVAAWRGLDVVLGGEVFRAMAAEHGMSLAAFGALAAAEPAVDVELDSRLAARARAGDVVVESRLAGWITHNEGLDALRVGLVCDEAVRAERVAAREGISVAQALADNAQREKTEHDRYQALYGVDIDDLSIYDLVVDTRPLTVEAAAQRIVDAARRA
jgi:predicted cytidylate kinase